MLVPILVALTAIMAGLYAFTIIQDYRREIDP